MEALNAPHLTPISLLSERRTEPRKIFSLPTTSPPKFQISSANLGTNPPKRFHGGCLMLLSSILSTGLARALTYEEALQQSVNSGASSSSDFDLNALIENPAVLIGGAAAVLVPVILSQVLGKKPKPWGVEPAKSAYAKLGEDVNAQLVDIRAAGEIRKVGSPDIRALKKKAVAIVYNGEDKPGFLSKLALKFKEPESTTLFILDKFDGNSELVAELATANGFKAAYAIKDGAEGSRGWMNSGLPWLLPKKTPSLDFSGLADAFSGSLGEDSGVLRVGLGLAAATGLGLVAFTEVETILQLLGSAALIQVLSKKLLFAEDRKQTLQQVDEFLSTKVAPKELVDDIKKIGTALLPSAVTSKALPAPAEATPAAPAEATPAVTENPVQKSEAVAADPPPPPQVNSVPKTEISAESLPGLSRPLSPYPYYPDYRPPTSPTPSQP